MAPCLTSSFGLNHMDRPALYLLAWMRHRPAMYFGTSENPFTALQAFLAGFTFGSDDQEKLPPELRVQARWDGFREFVAAHYGIDHNMNSMSWGIWIRRNSEDEQEAFATFFDLFEAYQKQSGLSWPDVKVGGERDPRE